MSLSIIIPSYNRYEYLTKQLNALEPQLDERTKIIVLDNYSTDLRYLNIAKKYNFTQVVRHPLNIGLVGNILRAYEYVNSGYFWILSDDDSISTNTVTSIQNAIESKPDHIYLSFNARGEGNLPEKHRYTTEEFIENFSSISTIGFISANIFSYTFVKEHIQQGYLAGRTLFPHVAIFFSALRQKKCVSVHVLKGHISFNPSDNTYPLLHHMTFLHHFDLGSFLNKEDEKKFRISYIKIWGADFLYNALTKKILYIKIKEIRSIREYLELIMSGLGAFFRLSRRKIKNYCSNK